MFSKFWVYYHRCKHVTKWTNQLYVKKPFESCPNETEIWALVKFVFSSSSHPHRFFLFFSFQVSYYCFLFINFRHVLFRQLCALNWILEAMMTEPPLAMDSITKCWNIKYRYNMKKKSAILFFSFWSVLVFYDQRHIFHETGGGGHTLVQSPLTSALHLNF